MAKLVNVSLDAYSYIFEDLADHRSDDWFLMGSIWPSVAISVSYVYFVKHLGPRLMEDRPSFNVDGLIKVYNLFQICASAYIFYLAIYLGAGWKHKLFCEPINYSTDPQGIKELTAMYHFYLLKISDLLDTIFFVLRKKNNQISFLHVYHHAWMVVGSWIWAKYVPGGHGSFTGILNCFVHIWMYLYYFVTTMWPEYKKNIWWKKYITQLQMVQFVIAFIHSASAMFVDNCYPFPGAFILAAQNLIFFTLFLNFYIKAYCKTKDL